MRLWVTCHGPSTYVVCRMLAVTGRSEDRGPRAPVRCTTKFGKPTRELPRTFMLPSHSQDSLAGASAPSGFSTLISNSPHSANLVPHHTNATTRLLRPHTLAKHGFLFRIVAIKGVNGLAYGGGTLRELLFIDQSLKPAL